MSTSICSSALQVAAVLLSLASPVALAQPAEEQLSFCKEGERVLVDCSSFDKKTRTRRVVSICGSKDLAASGGTLQLRAGPEGGAPDDLIPNPAEHPARHFVLSGSNRHDTWNVSLNVKSAQGTYVLKYSGSVYGSGDIGLSLEARGKGGRRTFGCDFGQGRLGSPEWIADEFHVTSKVKESLPPGAN